MSRLSGLPWVSRRLLGTRRDTALSLDCSVSVAGTQPDAFLAEKQQRSGSMRTVNATVGMLRDFFGRPGKTPDRVKATETFACVYAFGLSWKAAQCQDHQRSSLASSYFLFLIRMQLGTANPFGRLERPRPKQATVHGLSGQQVKRFPVTVPKTRVSLRDRAIILTLVLTGWRRAEVLSMKAGVIQQDGEAFVLHLPA